MNTKIDLSKKTKKKKSIFFKIGISLLSILIILIVIGIGTFYSFFNKVDKVKIDTTKLNINEKEKVSLISDNGKITVQVVVDDCIGDNIIMMYAGWWKKHGNPNYITISGISDIGGQVTYNETLVDIVKEKGE